MQCASGSFIHSRPFHFSVPFISLCFILSTGFHSISTHFISATSCTAQQEQCINFIRKAALFYSTSWQTDTTHNAIAKSVLHKTFHSTQPNLLNSIIALHLSYQPHKILVCFIFFCHLLAPFNHCQLNLHKLIHLIIT